MMATRTTRAASVLVILFLGGAEFLQARAEVVGAWTMSYTTKDGVKLESVLTVTQEGGKLAGTISSGRGSIALNEISVNGDDIAFAVIRVGFGDTIRIDYSGKIEGDSMKLKMKVGAREPLDVSA